jgi:hypothetical protein
MRRKVMVRHGTLCVESHFLGVVVSASYRV